MLTQVLKAPAVQLSNAELLAISPPLRDELRKQLTPKRVPNEKEGAAYLNQATAEPVLPSVQEMLANNKQLPPGVIRIPDPYETYVRSLGPHEQPRPITVAKESHSLRAIHALVGDRYEVDCVIDSGSQIVSMSKATCHALGVPYDPTIVLNMQSANGSVDSSLGLARNVPFRIGELTVYLQVHVIREAAYDILIGRPLDVLTESVVRTYNNEDTTLELHCPNSGISVTVPMHRRGKPRFYMPDKEQGF